jgi:hypothetical protein
MKKFSYIPFLLALSGCQSTSMKAVLVDEMGKNEVCEVHSYGITSGEKEAFEECISNYKSEGFKVISKNINE